MADRVGQQLGHYRLLRKIGQGAFAEVYLGEHQYLERLAAIKVLHGQMDPKTQEQFRREARTIAHLQHPHIVQVLDFGIHDQIPYLVMEYTSGGTLRSHHPKGTCLPLAQIVIYLKQIASALDYAHQQRVIHRDIKPENLLLNAQQEVVLSDFGLAVVQRTLDALSTQDPAGTPLYMAPEQILGKPCAASDQYALAVVVYEWLCGEPPFRGSHFEVYRQHLYQPPPGLCTRLPQLPPIVEDAVLGALAKDPQQRFSSVQDFATALQQACQVSLGESAQQEGGPPAPEHLVPDGQGSRRNEQSMSITWTRRADAVEPDFTDPRTVWHEEYVDISQRGPVVHPVEAPRVPQGTLPIHLTPFIGREQEVAAVAALLRRSEVRLLTLAGPGGVGKTRLAVQVATELLPDFADGIYFIPLAPISDAELVVPTIAQALQLEEARGRSFLDLLKASLQDKHLLLLLDNFEQILGAAPHLVALLTSCPHLKILVTSCATLHLQGEHEFPVPSLALPDLKQLPPPDALSDYAAVALFLQRAQAVKPSFQLTPANASAIAEICIRLDGLPLAIELAAARMKLFSPQALLARLGQRLQILTSGTLNVPARQQTLRNTIEWSYHLLDTQEQRLFRLLSVFVGGCTLEAVEAICSALDDGNSVGPVLEGVASLIDKSLLQRMEQEEEPEEPRFVTLETIREYGLECLIAHGEAEATQRAHAVYYLTLVEGIELELRGAQQRMWLERLEREHTNLRAVQRWLLEQSGEGKAGSSKEMTLRLGVALLPFWSNRGYWSEGRTFIKQALVESEGVAELLRARALDCAGILAFHQDDYDQAEALCGESLNLYRELGDSRGIDSELNILGTISWMRGKFATARSLIEEYLAHQKQKGNKRGIAVAFSHLAMVESGRGEYTSAHALLLESLEIFKAVGNREGIARTLSRLAWVVFVSQGDQVTAHSLLEEVLTLWKELGHKQAVAETFYLLGQLALHQSDSITAQALAEKSLMIAREGGNQGCIIDSLFLLAKVATAQSKNATARAFYEESLAIARKVDNKPQIASGLEGLAEVVAAQGEFVWAAWLWGAAESLRESIHAPLPPIFRSGYECAVAAARVQLGEKTFASVWAEGRTMTPEQALAKAERYGPNAPR